MTVVLASMDKAEEGLASICKMNMIGPDTFQETVRHCVGGVDAFGSSL